MTPLIFLFAVATPQSAATSANIGTNAPADTSSASKKTCRTTKLVGSNIPKRVCHTQVEWQAIDNADVVNRSRVMEGRRFSGQ